MIKNNFSISQIIAVSFFVFCVLFSFGQIVMAQNHTVGNFLEIAINPANPKPLEKVLVEIQSFSYDLDRSKISWLVNGQVKKTEMGLKKFDVLAGKNGEKTTIKASVETPQDGLREIEISFTPSVIDLIYESLSYTPPFYKGRSLNPNQGVVLVTAVPEIINSRGVKIPAQDLIYNWKKDGLVMQSDSGIGKNTFVFSGTIPIKDAVIEVNASSVEESISASQRITISNVSPKIVFYEENPVYGIMFNKAIKNTVNMTADEFQVKAFPYYMSVGYTKSPDLNYKWSINGNSVPNLDTDKSAMLFRQENSGSGTAIISLKIENTNRIFQFIENAFSINFEKI